MVFLQIFKKNCRIKFFRILKFYTKKNQHIRSYQKKACYSDYSKSKMPTTKKKRQRAAKPSGRILHTKPDATWKKPCSAHQSVLLYFSCPS
jgi:hypothetical protein